MLSYKCTAILENNNATKNVMAQLTYELLIFSEIPHKKKYLLRLDCECCCPPTAVPSNSDQIANFPSNQNCQTEKFGQQHLQSSHCNTLKIFIQI